MRRQTPAATTVMALLLFLPFLSCCLPEHCFHLGSRRHLNIFSPLPSQTASDLTFHLITTLFPFNSFDHNTLTSQSMREAKYTAIPREPIQEQISATCSRKHRWGLHTTCFAFISRKLTLVHHIVAFLSIINFYTCPCSLKTSDGYDDHAPDAEDKRLMETTGPPSLRNRERTGET